MIPNTGNVRRSPPELFLGKRCSENMQQIYRRTPMPRCNFNKVALPLYCNCTSAWVLSCKFTAYFQICCIFSEHLSLGTPLEAASEILKNLNLSRFLFKTFLGLNNSSDPDINFFQTVSTETMKYLDLENSITELKSLSEKIIVYSTLNIRST